MKPLRFLIMAKAKKRKNRSKKKRKTPKKLTALPMSKTAVYVIK
jgi:hypothetical protein